MWARARDICGGGNVEGVLAAQIRPFLGADVLEVGAGMGSITRAFCTSAQRSWTALKQTGRLPLARRSS